MLHQVKAFALVGAQAELECDAPLEPSPQVAAMCRAVRAEVPRLTADRPIGGDIDRLAAAIDAGLLVGAAS